MDKGVYKRQDRLIKEKRNDVYQEWGKMPEPTLCTKCGALFLKGRWSWEKPTERQIKPFVLHASASADNFPAGRIEIKGEIF